MTVLAIRQCFFFYFKRKKISKILLSQNLKVKKKSAIVKKIAVFWTKSSETEEKMKEIRDIATKKRKIFACGGSRDRLMLYNMDLYEKNAARRAAKIFGRNNFTFPETEKKNTDSSITSR